MNPSAHPPVAAVPQGSSDPAVHQGNPSASRDWSGKTSS